jgi:hypothetical protein
MTRVGSQRHKKKKCVHLRLVALNLTIKSMYMLQLQIFFRNSWKVRLTHLKYQDVKKIIYFF